MQYPVPQFQDVEDKIIGSLTFKQFIYILGGAGLSYTILQSVPTGLNYILILIVGGISLALAFYKVNNQPLLNIVEAAFYYMIKSRLYLWSHTYKKKSGKMKTTTQQQESIVEVPNINDSRMKELAWSLDINENIQRAEKARSITEHNVLSEL